MSQKELQLKLQEISLKLKQEKLLAQNKSAANTLLLSIKLQLSNMPDSVTVSARKV